MHAPRTAFWVPVFFLLNCLSASAQISDVALFEADEKYINPEFSGDGLHVTYTTVPDPLMPEERVVIYDEVNALGFPMGGAAEGRVVGAMAAGGLAYWGTTGYQPESCPGFNGHFSVFVGASGYFNVLFARDGDLPCAMAIGPSQDPSSGEDRIRRKIPFPMKNPQSDGLWIVYQIRDWDQRTISTRIADLSATSVAPVVIEDEKFINESGQRANALVHWPWWAAGTNELYYLTFDGCVSECTHRVATQDVANLAVSSQVVANASPEMLGLYPFLLDGENYLYFGLNDRPYGLFYQRMPQGNYQPVRTLGFDPAQTTLFPSAGTMDVYNVQSMETFQWQGESYASYSVSERNSNGLNQGFANQTEIWVVKLDGLQSGEPLVRCRVSEDDVAGNPVARTEPEPVVLGDEAYILYTAGEPVIDEFDYQYNWRRVHLGDKAAFDANCAAGTVWSSMTASAAF